jgi:hypothetical protein
MDGFPFSESRYVNSHIDYETYIRENTYYERIFALPNDRLSVYRNAVNRGIFNFDDTASHHVEIILKDTHNNISSLDFNVISVHSPARPTPDPKRKDLTVMPYSRTNRFRADNISVTIPAGALYDTIRFSYRRDTGTPQMLSDVHYIHNKQTPVHKAYTISIRPSVIPAGKESKLLLVQMGDDFKKSALASTFAEGYVTADALSFGMFYAGIDTVPPFISANGFSSGADLSGRSEMRIRITDDLSGIREYQPLIDGKWALFEYDQKNDVLIYKFDPKRIVKGTKHEFSLKVTDNKDNQGVFSCEFMW